MLDHMKEAHKGTANAATCHNPCSTLLETWGSFKTHRLQGTAQLTSRHLTDSVTPDLLHLTPGGLKLLRA